MLTDGFNISPPGVKFLEAKVEDYGSHSSRAIPSEDMSAGMPTGLAFMNSSALACR